ncbi:MAG TPA: endonuclease domain-containing protein [Longimicrobiaceae bacterium]|nr:endonuclease domain-containing protein [Longimicrobiaceae bacterium]
MEQRRRIRGTTPEVEKRARALRREMTEAEITLWRSLRGQRIRGLSFRRQHPVLSFIVDFYCPARKLCIELDGGIHDTPDQMTRDVARTAALEAGGYHVIRFRNEEVMRDLSSVLRRIRASLDTL